MVAIFVLILVSVFHGFASGCLIEGMCYEKLLLD